MNNRYSTSELIEATLEQLGGDGAEVSSDEVWRAALTACRDANVEEDYADNFVQDVYDRVSLTDED